MYEKMTFLVFKKLLSEGKKYESATAARRAVGKASEFNETEKEAARKLIDAKFGGSEKPAPAKAAKAAKPVSAKPAVKPAPAAKKKAQTTVSVRQPVSVVRTSVATTQPSGFSDQVTQANLAERTIVVMSQANSSLLAQKSASLSVDDAQFQEIQATLSEATNTLRRLLISLTPATISSPAASIAHSPAHVEESVDLVDEDPTDEGLGLQNGIYPGAGVENAFRASLPAAE